MRFMMLMYPGNNAYREREIEPEALSAMMQYNEELANAGVLLSLDGLQSPDLGARITFDNRKPTVIDGPYIEAKELLGGFWMIKVDSKQEAIDWASRCPVSPGEWIEVRQVFEMPDYGIEPGTDLAEQAGRIEAGIHSAAGASS
jgi:hypothetical protein